MKFEVTEMALDPDSFMPMRKLCIEVVIPHSDSGGRCMYDCEIKAAEHDLKRGIMDRVQGKVVEYIRVIDPYGCLRMPKEEVDRWTTT